MGPSTDARRIPEGLRRALRPVTLVVGHYGVGKTNFAINLTCDLAAEGAQATLVDLDIVNPYFRASEQRAALEARGVALVAPVFAEAGTSLDVPSLTGRIAPAIQGAGDGHYVIVDVGGDDAGAVALGRFAHDIERAGYRMLGVLNRFRNLVQDPADAVENLREIQVACGLSATALVNNSHLKQATTAEVVAEGIAYAREVAALAELPLACTTVPEGIGSADLPLQADEAYAVVQIVTTPWGT